MSRTESDAETPCAEEAEGVPCDDWGAVRTGERSSTSSHGGLLPVTRTGLLADEDGLAQLYRQYVQTESVQFRGTVEGEWADTAKASEP